MVPFNVSIDFFGFSCSVRLAWAKIKCENEYWQKDLAMYGLIHFKLMCFNKTSSNSCFLHKEKDIVSCTLRSLKRCCWYVKLTHLKANQYLQTFKHNNICIFSILYTHLERIPRFLESLVFFHSGISQDETVSPDSRAREDFHPWFVFLFPLPTSPSLCELKSKVSYW